MNYLFLTFFLTAFVFASADSVDMTHFIITKTIALIFFVLCLLIVSTGRIRP